MPHDFEQHAQHDPLLVVSLAAGDLTGAERDLATSLVTDCGECATLQDDLLAIARATAALPTAVRPRDFQLTPDQASRLRPLGWRRFAAAFASPRLAMTRQLGIGLTTLGLAGLLVSALPTVNLGMGGAASAPSAPAAALQATEDTEFSGESLASAAAPMPSAAASDAAASASLRTTSDTAQPSGSADPAAAPFATYPDRSSASDGGTKGNVTAQGSRGADVTAAPIQVERQGLDQSATDQRGPSTFVVVSAILLAAGIALLIARRIARA